MLAPSLIAKWLLQPTSLENLHLRNFILSFQKAVCGLHVRVLWALIQYFRCHWPNGKGKRNGKFLPFHLKILFALLHFLTNISSAIIMNLLASCFMTLVQEVCGGLSYLINKVWESRNSKILLWLIKMLSHEWIQINDPGTRTQNA